MEEIKSDTPPCFDGKPGETHCHNTKPCQVEYCPFITKVESPGAVKEPQGPDPLTELKKLDNTVYNAHKFQCRCLRIDPRSVNGINLIEPFLQLSISDRGWFVYLIPKIGAKGEMDPKTGICYELCIAYQYMTPMCAYRSALPSVTIKALYDLPQGLLMLYLKALKERQGNHG